MVEVAMVQAVEKSR